ncbi:uncharacterized protein [Typha latifolia]|uniref:uncharacterized protein n=1 Tax=Typha latifolia TaxID=4733 RepID=UPI003C307F1A
MSLDTAGREMNLSVCNGSKYDSSVDSNEVKEGGETNSLLLSAVDGRSERMRKKNAKRKVQWNDDSGNKLVEVLEFQPSDSSDSEDDSSTEFSIWGHAIVSCALLCCCLGV